MNGLPGGKHTEGKTQSERAGFADARGKQRCVAEACVAFERELLHVSLTAECDTDVRVGMLRSHRLESRFPRRSALPDMHVL